MTFQNILHTHLLRYPAIQMQDLYKLVFQAVFGCGHAMSDGVTVRERLEAEIMSMGAGPDEPIVDILSEDTGIVRVHLRPYIAKKGDPLKLLDAFLRTGNEFQANNQWMTTYWAIVMTESAEKRIPFSMKELDEYHRQMQKKGYPTVHHTLEYVGLYKPAYRVIMREFIKIDDL